MTVGKIGAGAVGETKLATDAVIAVKIKDGAVTAGKIGAGAVTVGKIGTGAVGETKLATDAVITVKIKDREVTNDKLAGSINYNKILASSLPTAYSGLTDIESSLYKAPAMANVGKGGESGGYILFGSAIGTATPNRPFVLWRDGSGYVRITS